MTELIDTIPCAVCGKQRQPDNRKPCEHCGKRSRDAKGAVVKADAGEQRVQGSDLVVVASDPQEMVTAQNNMIARLDEKIAAQQQELTGLETAPLALASGAEVEAGSPAWTLLERARSQLQAANGKLVSNATRRLVYLQKIRAALAAGYVMMPNFPGHVIAIRTARARPAVKTRYDISQREDAEAAAPDPALPPGEGTYVSPIPEHTHHRSGERQDLIIDGWDEEIGLPVEFLHPTVVQRTAKALDLKIFDEIVLVRDGDSRDSFAKQHNPPRGRDPMVVGRVIFRTRNQTRRWEWRRLSFLVAWFMDTKLI